jgi:hypothetical protein
MPFNIYFILANPVSPNLGGYEFAWRFSPTLDTDPIILPVALPPTGSTSAKAAASSSTESTRLSTILAGLIRALRD